MPINDRGRSRPARRLREAPKPAAGPRGQNQVAAIVLAAFLLGFTIGYAARAQPNAAGDNQPSIDTAVLLEQIHPPGGYPLGFSYGDLGPRLVAAGVIDAEAFLTLYEQAGQPLDPRETAALMRGSDEEVVITEQNSYFLLNFFWAVGLANQNPILTDGPMAQYGDAAIEGFASTGGWSLANRPVTELYSSLDLIALTDQQQERLEKVAASVYRPCCDNPTLFPDCNHGMAMLGILEMMASQNATEDEMFEAARSVNASWFPGHTLESAVYLQITQHVEYSKADARLLTGSGLASASGFAALHQELQRRDLLPQDAVNSGSCAN